MHVFVTGATGWVGSAVIDELVAAGHTAIGLARSDDGERALAARGIASLRGTLADVATLRRGADATDAVIHCAFNHDFMRSRGDAMSGFAEAGAEERQAIGVLGEIAGAGRKPLIVTSGVALITPGRVVTEDDRRDPAIPFPRDPETAAAEAAANGARVSVIRLAPSVHGAGDKGFVPFAIAAAREHGRSVYVGEGANRWPGVHRRDAARLYVRALDRAADHAVYHAVADEGVPYADLARAIAKRLRVPAVSVTADEAAAHFGWFAHFAAIDAPASSAKTRTALGWEPREPGLLADVDSEAYFPVGTESVR